MARRFVPDLMLTARCPRLDPAVYMDFYFPRLARALPMGPRLGLCALAARVPPRDLYCLLATPADVAMARIEKRLEELAAAEAESGREHWLHLHEQQDVLAGLGRGMEQALELLRRRDGAEVMVVDNSVMRQGGVVELLADRVLWLHRQRRGLSLPGPRPACHHGISDLPVSRISPLAPLPENRPRDRWVVYCVRGQEGAEAWLARFSGRAPKQEPLSCSFLVRGDEATGAWGGAADDPLALVAYHEPSRTEVWGVIVDSQARVRARPFVIAAAPDDHLLCDLEGQGSMKVAWHDAPGRWRVTCGSWIPEERTGTPDRVLTVEVDLDGSVESPEAPESSTD